MTAPSHTEHSGESVAELERATIAGLLCEGGTEEIPRVLEIVAPPDFFDTRLGTLLGRLDAMREARTPITLPTLADELDRAGELAPIGGRVFLAELSDYAATAALATHHAKLVKRNALERRERILHSRATEDRDPEIRQQLGDVGEQLRALDPWPPVLPLESCEALPFPTATLPPWLCDFVRAEAEATQTPTDLPGVLVLAALAATLAKRARVFVNEGHREQLNLYAAVALDPGNLKSAVFSAVAAPLMELERDLAEQGRRECARLEEKLERLEAERASARKKGEQTTAEALAAEVGAVKEQLASLPLRLLGDDATPEAVAMRLARHGGRFALLSAEGGEFFEMARGRYAANGRANIGVYLSAHSGDPIRVDRRRESFYCENPALTLGLAVQPGVISGLRDESVFAERGLLARFLFSIPRSRLGSRDFRAAIELPAKVRAEYRERLLHLAALPLEDRDISLSIEARDLYLAFRQDELEPALAEGGELAWLSDWASKLPGAALRIAGLLHAGHWADRRDLFDLAIEGSTMANALELARYFLSHARAAFLMMRADPEIPGALKLWRFAQRWSERNGRALEVPERELWQGAKGGRFTRPADMAGPLALLERHGYLRRIESPHRRSTGRQRGPRYRINPSALVGDAIGGNGGATL